MFVRMKCTLKDSGRVVNLKHASYKSFKITGKTSKKMEGLTSPVFLGVAQGVGCGGADLGQVGVFVTEHSMDMKFRYVDKR